MGIADTSINAILAGKPFDPIEAQNQLAEIEYRKLMSEKGRMEMAQAREEQNWLGKKRAMAEEEYQSNKNWTGKERTQKEKEWGQADEAAQKADIIAKYYSYNKAFATDTDRITHNNMVRVLKSSPELQKLYPLTKWNQTEFEDDETYTTERAIEAVKVKHTASLIPREKEWKPESKEEYLEVERAKREDKGVTPHTDRDKITQSLSGGRIKYYSAADPELKIKVDEEEKRLAIRKDEELRATGDEAQFERWAKKTQTDISTPENYRKEYNAWIKNFGKTQASKLEIRTAEAPSVNKKIALSVSDDFENDISVKAFKELEPKYNAMETALKRWKAGDAKTAGAVDQYLITTYNKFSDPSSVVRESEYARTPEGMALLDRFEGKYKQYTKGGAGLTDEYRTELVEMAREIRNAYANYHNKALSKYKRKALKLDVDPDLIGEPAEIIKGTGEAKTSGSTQRQEAFGKLKATGKYSDQQINDYLDRKGIK